MICLRSSTRQLWPHDFRNPQQFLRRCFIRTRHRSFSEVPEIHSSLRQPLHILGSGSIGLFLAGAVSAEHPTCPLQILLRDHHAPNLQRGDNLQEYIQVSIQQPSLENRQLNVRVPATLISSLQNQTIQTLVLTTKSFQAVTALESVHSLLHEKARIIVLCNGGLAVREELEQAFSKDWKIELASITHGVYRQKSTAKSPYSLVHAGLGKVFLVSQDDDVQDVFSPSLLNAANLHCQVVSRSEMEKILWHKLAVNCICNPLTALHQCTNGEMYKHVPDLDRLIQSIVQEICAVQRALVEEGTEIEPQYLDAAQVTGFVHQVIEDNWHNHSSMQQDVLHRRPTEINHLNGYIVRAGAQHGVDCPINQQLQRQVLELQETYAFSGDI